MPLKIIRGNHWEIIGRGRVLLSSPPALGQAGEYYTGRIVEEAALLSKAHAVIEREGKGNFDSSSLELTVQEFQSGTKGFLDEFEIKCVMEILGKEELGIEINSFGTGSEPGELVDIVRERFVGDFSLRIGSPNTDARDDNPSKMHVIRLMLGPEERGLRKDSVVSGIADAVNLLNAKLGYSVTDERASGVLD